MNFTILEAMLFLLEQGQKNLCPSSGVQMGVTWNYKTNGSSLTLLSKHNTTGKYVFY